MNDDRFRRSLHHPRRRRGIYHIQEHHRTLSGHALGTKDCLTMGPRIITCGLDDGAKPSIRIWGSEFFVRTELSKLFIKP
jgi:hypothetical protein